MRQFQIYLEMYCLDPSTLLVSVCKKSLLLLSISVVIGQFSSKWPGSSSCTVSNLKENYKCNRMSARKVLYNNELCNIVGYLYSFRALSLQQLIQLDI